MSRRKRKPPIGNWLTREHILERVGVDGFLLGRAFLTIEPLPRRYFICYELADSSALAGPSYLGRLNAPTPRDRLHFHDPDLRRRVHAGPANRPIAAHALSGKPTRNKLHHSIRRQ